MTFQDLQLIPQLLTALQELNYREPSPIQASAIPPVRDGRDLIGCAQTGTGKTAAFALPILQRLEQTPRKGHRHIRALILTPTRELALQIRNSFADYGKYLSLRTTVIFGGVGQAPQVEALQKGVDILVATPGRLNDLCNQGFIDLAGLETFVLDEADRMLDMGFIHDVRKVIARLPEKRQTLLFSATMPHEIAELSRTILRDPVRVEVTPQSSTVDAIDQYLYKVDRGNKKHLLLHILQDKSLDSVLVFTGTKHRADRVVKLLSRDNIPAMAIHGNKSQTARVKALESFKDGSIRVLVATDIAARGIDVNELSCVVNYDLPNVPETYVHRIGRTGRAGRSGVAVSFCTVDELPYLRDIEKLIGKQVPEVTEHPWPMEILEPTPKSDRQPRTAGRSQKPNPKPVPSKASNRPTRKSDRPAAEVRTEHTSLPSSAVSPEKASEKISRPAPRISSGGPELPGRLVASADGRKHRRHSRTSSSAQKHHRNPHSNS